MDAGHRLTEPFGELARSVVRTSVLAVGEGDRILLTRGDLVTGTEPRARHRDGVA